MYTQPSFWELCKSVIQEASFALHSWLSHFDFTNPVVLVSSHLPSEEHTQEKISEDCEKEGFDIFISPSALPSPSPIRLFSIPSDDPSLSKAFFQQDIYIS